MNGQALEHGDAVRLTDPSDVTRLLDKLHHELMRARKCLEAAETEIARYRAERDKATIELLVLRKRVQRITEILRRACEQEV